MESGFDPEIFDDDGKPKRTRTLLTATSHIITAFIGSGVLSLEWVAAQLGWIAGPIILLSWQSLSIARRNYTYMEAVKANLGEGFKYKLCGLAQYGFFVATAITYNITASNSLAAIKRFNRFRKNGHEVECDEASYPYIIIFAIVEIILSQILNFHKLSWLSIVAAIMSLAYALIGLGLSIGKIAAGGNDVKTSLIAVTVGVEVASHAQKVFRVFQALGNVASAYFYSTVIIEVQDTLKSSPPKNKVMKKASTIGILITTLFYMLCGTVGYVAFGNKVPGNFLTGFGVYELFWLIDLGNACFVVHLVGAYQVFCQPFFSFVEQWCCNSWPQNKYISKMNGVNNLFKLLWRTLFVIMTAIVAMIFPFINDMMGLISTATFRPLGVYFPVEMYLVQSKSQRFSAKWIWLKILSLACCVVSIVAAVGSIHGLIANLTKYEPFS
ncbi:hypothetical protein AQUCO_04000004v1 [Aquilegia coerulea]|uniref:Amino acid transporter transmembrane domain-containing protein n=1 Tax=Aquilegia coerulea TaxID=218851 RepID=A0A2G5CQT6_AQUCA|nr:hypothetical protein AQUCO_04000004v1 [Aquilegia coerulea]